jgi:hypothetical protein
MKALSVGGTKSVRDACVDLLHAHTGRLRAYYDTVNIRVGETVGISSQSVKRDLPARGRDDFLLLFLVPFGPRFSFPKGSVSRS